MGEIRQRMSASSTGEGGSEDTAHGQHQRETGALEEGILFSSVVPTVGDVAAGNEDSLLVLSARDLYHLKSGVPKFDGKETSFPEFQYNFLEFLECMKCKSVVQSQTTSKWEVPRLIFRRRRKQASPSIYSKFEISLDMFD